MKKSLSGLCVCLSMVLCLNGSANAEMNEKMTIGELAAGETGAGEDHPLTVGELAAQQGYAGEHHTLTIGELAAETGGNHPLTVGELAAGQTGSYEEEPVYIEEADASSLFMGEEAGKADWLVYVYMCGSDLESEGGQATMDIQEMLDGNLGERCAFIVDAAGSNSWNNNLCDPERQNKFMVVNQKAAVLERCEDQSMGAPETLATFLTDTAGDLEAEHYGLVIWNHGGGSISGVCMDERHEYDALSLSEVTEALETAGRHFDFIGFDCCLMGGFESAAAVRNYADYMIGSEELVQGVGFDYKSIGDCLGSGETDGAVIGKVICDSYYDCCLEYGIERETTMSVLDLGKFQSLQESLETTAGKMVECLQDPDILVQTARDTGRVENYGGNNAAEGYTNMADMTGILKVFSDYVPEVSETIRALQEMVSYEIHGEGRKKAKGLSIFYPYGIQSSVEIAILEAVNPCSNYVDFVKRLVYASFMETMEGYSSNAFDTLMANYDAGIAPSTGLDAQSDVGNALQGDESELEIHFVQEPFINEDGLYEFTIAEDSLDTIKSVGFDLFQVVEEDPDGSYYLGYDNNVSMDWDTGRGVDAFNGTWPSLPDGQELMFFMIDEAEEYTLFSAPVIVNGEEKFLRFCWEWDDPSAPESGGSFCMLGLWSGLDEGTGIAGRCEWDLYVGDEISPLYYRYDQEGNLEEVSGSVYVATEDMEITEMTLRKGYYIYCFDITDIYGKTYYSEPICFEVDENGNVVLV
ncbi:MAG: hypothetical protein HUJ72_07830 [Blautia sp.]|nr:hypothetical protein [Blautia sp.]